MRHCTGRAPRHLYVPVRMASGESRHATVARGASWRGSCVAPRASQRARANSAVVRAAPASLAVPCAPQPSSAAETRQAHLAGVLDPRDRQAGSARMARAEPVRLAGHHAPRHPGPPSRRQGFTSTFRCDRASQSARPPRAPRGARVRAAHRAQRGRHRPGRARAGAAGPAGWLRRTSRRRGCTEGRCTRAAAPILPAAVGRVGPRAGSKRRPSNDGHSTSLANAQGSKGPVASFGIVVCRIGTPVPMRGTPLPGRGAGVASSTADGAPGAAPLRKVAAAATIAACRVREDDRDPRPG